MTLSQRIPSIALSVRQPWAWAIIHAGKPVENRSKLAITKGGMRHGHIAIHASKGMTRDEYEDARDFMATIGVRCPRPDELVRGAIIGHVRCTGYTNKSESPWFFGPWALELENPIACRPVPAIGQLGYFVWDELGQVAEPLPWMISWPERAVRTHEPRPKAIEQGLLI
jgi:hypothetical protein